MLSLKAFWEPRDIASRLPSSGGIGFIFHATDWQTISLAFHGSGFAVDDLWAHGPFIGSPIFDGNEVIGCHIVSPLPAELWVTSRMGIRRFRDLAFHPSMTLAQECGLTHIGLAALVPFATRFGELPSSGFLGYRTTGHAATVAAIYRMIEQLRFQYTIPVEELSYAIFGAAGSIGSNVARWLARNGLCRQLLIDLPSRLSQVQALSSELTVSHPDGKFSPHTSETIETAADFDIGIVATNAATPWLTGSVLAKAPLWIDDSHPQAASDSLAREADVAYLECCLLAPHGMSQTFPFRLPTPRHCYACFAEVYLCWRSRMTSNFVTGRATLHQIARMDELLQSFGFTASIDVSKSGTSVPATVLARACQRLRDR